jgi:hypothetical protein
VLTTTPHNCHSRAAAGVDRRPPWWPQGSRRRDTPAGARFTPATARRRGRPKWRVAHGRGRCASGLGHVGAQEDPGRPRRRFRLSRLCPEQTGGCIHEPALRQRRQGSYRPLCKGERTCLMPDHLRYRRPVPLPPQCPRIRLPPCDAIDLPAEAALRHRPPRHQGEFAALRDHREPTARQFDRPEVDTLDTLAGPDLGLIQAHLVRELTGDTAQFAASQNAQHVGAVDGWVLLVRASSCSISHCRPRAKASRASRPKPLSRSGTGAPATSFPADQVTPSAPCCRLISGTDSVCTTTGASSACRRS